MRPHVQLLVLYAASAWSMTWHRFKSGEDGFGGLDGLNGLKRQAPAYPAYTIDMPIDHFPNDDGYKPHAQGTFKQRYFFDASQYKPGGPVFLYIAGETDARNRFSNLATGVIKILTSATNGLGVILENRYYGQSWPFNVSTTDDLVYLTNEQTIADIAYFAQHATFPGVGGSLTAPGAPWILYGGSLAGAQAAFAVKTYGNVLYGGIASSAPIQVKLGYPEWYNPVQKYGPSDCIYSINNIVDKFDALVDANNKAAIDEFKALFGLSSLKDNRDFAGAMAFPIGGPFYYPTTSWQELDWRTQSQAPDFWSFCANVTNIDAPPEVRNVDSAMAKYSDGEPWTNLGNYAQYVKTAVLATCPSGNYNTQECFGTQNKADWAATANNMGRSYLYTTCLEGGLYQVAPETGKSLISRVLQANYTQDWCNWAFPPGKYNSIPPTPDLELWNRYGGLDMQAQRLAFIDGSIDPWLDSTYHSETAPPRSSSDLHPSYLIVGGGHHWDSYGLPSVSAEPQFIREAHQWEIRTVKKWLRGFSSWKKPRQ